MTQINNYSQNIPVNNGYTAQVPQNQVATPQVNVATPNGVTPIYQYPTTSLYNPNTNQTSKQAASGVNIYIYNPSGVGGGCTSPNGNVMAAPMMQQQQSQTAPVAQAPISEEPLAQTPIEKAQKTDETNENAKKGDLIEITDDYVKSVENYLRSPDAEVRKMGITELVNRFEEDPSRYNHPALNALLNIALQDPSEYNRLLAMAPIASESAHGDTDTSKILQNLTTSTKLSGQEAKMAQEALLKTLHSK